MHVKQKEFMESVDISVTMVNLDIEHDELTKKQEKFNPHQLGKKFVTINYKKIYSNCCDMTYS